MATNKNSVASRLYRSIPLIPVFSIIFNLIVIFSPMTWTARGLNYTFMIGAVVLGVLCAYCTTLFLDQYLDGNN
jgi:hypothetical protein